MYVKMFWMKTVALTKNDVTAFPDAVAAENKNQKIRNLFWKYFRAGLNNMQQNSNRNRKGLLSKAFLMSFFFQKLLSLTYFELFFSSNSIKECCYIIFRQCHSLHPKHFYIHFLETILNFSDFEVEDGFSEMYVKMFWMKTVALTKNDVTAFLDAVAAEK